MDISNSLKQFGFNKADTPLKTRLKVTYIQNWTDNEYAISDEVSSDLLSCDYTDVIGDEGDELSITLKDEKGKWADTWSPERGDVVDVEIITENRGTVKTGKMSIDKLDTSGRPRIFIIGAVSIPLNNTIRRTVKTRNFENLSLKEIAQKLCDENELELVWDCEDDESNPTYDRTDQQRQSDLDYLNKLCTDAGLTLKIFNGKLTIFSQLSYEKKEPIATLTEDSSKILNWSFSCQQSERYRSVTCTYRNIELKTRTISAPTQTSSSDEITQNGMTYDRSAGKFVTKKNVAPKGDTVKTTKSVEYIEYTYEDENVDISGQNYVLKQRAPTIAEAKRLAKNKLRQLNLRQLTGSLTLIGNPALCAGVVVALKGFGSFDGNFIIEKSSHSMSGSGYVTSIDVRRVNTEY